MPKIVKVLVPMDIDTELLDNQRAFLFSEAERARKLDETSKHDALEGLIGIIDAITDEVG